MDSRNYSYYPAWIRQDHKRMMLVIGDEAEYPAAYGVCPVCEGRGRYVNPAIDEHGITSEDLDEDPNFIEDYLDGRYDIACRSCNGQRVILVPSTEDGQRVINEALDEEHSYRAAIESERRMGA